MTTNSKQQNKGGRPAITFSPDYIELAYNYSLLGADTAKLAQFFSVPEPTISRWQKDYPDFASAIKRGRILADASIAESLFRSGLGYEYTVTETRKIIGASGKVIGIEEISTTAHMPPNPVSCICWLKNRHPDKWSDKFEVEYTDKRNQGKTGSDTASPLSTSKE